MTSCAHSRLVGGSAMAAPIRRSEFTTPIAEYSYPQLLLEAV